MMKRKMLLTASVAVLIAFAVPAMASASWTHSGSALTGNGEVEFSGPFNFAIPGVFGMERDIHLEATLVGNSNTVEVTSFTDTSCVGTGQLEGFPCTGTAQNLPWIGHIVGHDIVIDNISLTTHYYVDSGHSFLVATSELTGDIIATPDNPFGINAVTLEGSGTEANGNPATVEGELAVTPEGTYGVT